VTIKRFFAALLIISLPLSTLAAQAMSPEQVIASMMTSLGKEDWDTFTNLMHPDALQQFKTLFHDVLISDSSDQIGSYLFGVPDLQAFDNMSASKIYKQFMTNLYNLEPSLRDVLSNTSYEILGSVKEGNELVHVLYRIKMEVGGKEVQQLEIETVQNYQGQWRTLLRKDITAVADQLKESLKEGSSK
jgi:hypothetical protein